MGWTSGRDPSGSRRDNLRLLVGDIDTTEHLLEDAEIDYYLTLSDNDFTVAYLLCMALSGVMARQVSQAIGPLKEEAQQKFDHYQRLAAVYYGIAQGGGPGVVGLGTATPVLSQRADIDRLFTREYPA